MVDGEVNGFDPEIGNNVLILVVVRVDVPRF